MKTEDWMGMGFYLICSISMIICGIMRIRDDRKQNEPDYSTGILTILAGITPGCMLIGGLLLFVAIIYLIVEVPNMILKKLLKTTK